jgi:hypothetical protein
MEPDSLRENHPSRFTEENRGTVEQQCKNSLKNDICFPIPISPLQVIN